MYVHVEDVEDRSNTHKGFVCRTSKMGKEHTHTFWLITSLILNGFSILMSKMSKIDQIHIRAVMLCMSKTSKMGKEHTHTFWLITSLILNGVESLLYHQILCMSKHVMSKIDQIHQGCNAMYVDAYMCTNYNVDSNTKYFT